MIEAKKYIELMERNVYNEERPDYVIIRELIEVIVFLNERIEKLENETSKAKEV